MASTVAERIAMLYDATVPGWPDELAFYREMAAEARGAGQAVLELGCGTGRVALRLAEEGTRVVGLDISADMLAVARAKSAGMPNVRWVQGTMRSFWIGEAFGLVIIPGHSFQAMLTPEEQYDCLTSIRNHLLPGGRLVVHLDHQDVAWLAQVAGEQKGIFRSASSVKDPQTGATIRTQRAWSYEPSTQTATSVTVWEVLGEDGSVVDRWERAPMRLHCVFRSEMAHALARAGFEVEALYGDFARGQLTDTSTEMIWIARPSGNPY
ncbi:MAG: class I SAM-dependent methyltransferase [Anaerolineales bacterium]|nr:class I SAM-dependent methyltransferase [Anaerolineales bacterium]